MELWLSLGDDAVEKVTPMRIRTVCNRRKTMRKVEHFGVH
jgi:hypothetical protein